MAPIRIGRILLPLAGIGATALQAQDATPPPPAAGSPPPSAGQLPDAAPPAVGSHIPPNVTITTPDGKPLSPEMLERVLKDLESDPAMRSVLDGSTPAPVRRDVGGTEIVVTAMKLRGSVLGNVPPLRRFDPIDIRAYGARDIGELVADLGAEVKSSHGEKRPIVLLNGNRISDFQEIADYPTEAIERLEVFPEELALQYGYPADQKVINVVTFDPFDSRSAYLDYDLPTGGGRNIAGLNGRYLHIAGRSRYKLNIGYERSEELLESQRRIIQPPGASGEAQYRTLLPGGHKFTLGGSFSNNISEGIPITVRGDVSSGRQTALFGLGVAGPLHQYVNTFAANLGATSSGRVKKWLWTSTAVFHRTSDETSVDSDQAAGEKGRAHAVAEAFSTDASLTGSLFRLPAGSVSAALRAALAHNQFSSGLGPAGTDQSVRLTRNQGTVFANVNVPLANRRAKSSAWLGDLSANAQIGFDRLTNLGTLSTYGFGIYWSPAESIRVRASATRQRDAPLLEQLGAPLILTPNFRTFDYARGETVDVTQIFGGNGNLRADDRRVFGLGFTIKPFRGKNIDLVADYTRIAIDNPIVPFPILTQQVQDLFPERFTRDSSGRLLSIDTSPVNLRRSDQSQLRWGLNFTDSLGKLPGGSELIFSPVTDGTIPPGTLPPNSRVIDNPPGTPLPPEIENAISRVYFSFYHTYHVRDTVLLRDGSPVLDLLDGFALDSRGGKSRHELTFAAGLFRRGVGARLNVRWQSPTSVRGLATQTGGTGSTLRFTYPVTADLNFFVNPQDRLNGGSSKWLKGVQIGVSIVNLLDTRPVVRDESGLTPFNYQAPYLDPIGRSIHLSLRKIF
ncbi:MAG: TonB-dependent receptor [Allosphingosinicella sp.]